MRTLWTTTLLIACCGLGCQQADSVSLNVNDSDSNSNQSATDDDTTIKESSNEESAQQERADIVVSLDDLKARLEMFPNEVNWTSGERTPGELAGKWVSQDQDQEVVIFHADGSFSEDFNGNMTTGFFMISDSGRIATLSSWKDVQLGSHFQFDGETIVGPKGPLPRVEWKRVKE